MGASSSDSSARRSYVELSESSTQDAATKTCLWPCDEYMMHVGINEEFEKYFTMLALVPTFQISVNNANFSLSHLSKDSHFSLVSLGRILSFMIIHLPSHWRILLTIANCHFWVHLMSHQRLSTSLS